METKRDVIRKAIKWYKDEFPSSKVTVTYIYKYLQSKAGLQKYRDMFLDEISTKKYISQEIIIVENKYGANGRVIIPQSINPFKEIPNVLLPSFDKVGICSDIHFPFHCDYSLNKCLEHFEKENVDAIYLNGDILDCYSISRYPKEIRVDIVEEFDIARTFFELLRQTFKNIPIYYKFGNHEDRYEHYLAQNAPSLMIEQTELKHLLNFYDYNIIHIKSKQLARYMDFDILHGHELQSGMGSPINPARSLFAKRMKNTIVGHHHITSYWKENKPEVPIKCYTMGGLLQLQQGYAPFNAWNNGYGILHKISNTECEVQNIELPKTRSKYVSL
jgi:predicted phosphodiesterase